MASSSYRKENSDLDQVVVAPIAVRDPVSTCFNDSDGKARRWCFISLTPATAAAASPRDVGEYLV